MYKQIMSYIRALLDRCKEPRRLDDLCIVIRKIPANDRACLTTADNATSIELQLEHAGHISLDVMMSSAVVMLLPGPQAQTHELGPMAPRPPI